MYSNSQSGDLVPTIDDVKKVGNGYRVIVLSSGPITKKDVLMSDICKLLSNSVCGYKIKRQVYNILVESEPKGTGYKNFQKKVLSDIESGTCTVVD